MLERVRKVMASLTGHEMSAIYIQDLLAVDTFIPRKVQGGMAGECAMETGCSAPGQICKNDSRGPDRRNCVRFGCLRTEYKR